MIKVIFLPGMDGSGIMFEPLIALLPKTVDFIVLPLSSDGDQSYSAQAEHISNKIGNEDVILFAESYSGYLAYLTYKLKPDNVKHIIFAASFLINPNWLTKLSFLLPIRAIKRGLIPTFWINLLCFNHLAHPGAFSCFYRSLNTVSVKKLKERLRNISNLKTIRYEIEVPCTYIQPSHDYLVSKLAVKHLLESCHTLQVHNINGGHFIAQSNVVGCMEVINNVTALYLTRQPPLL